MPGPGYLMGAPTGRPPTIFDGDRQKADDFMDEWNLFCLNNTFNYAFALPYQRVANCLSYIKGPKVANWNRTQVQWLHNVTTRNVNPVGYDNQWLWDTFADEFRSAFQDTAAEQNAERNLSNLQMKGGELDTYISNFTELARKANRSLQDKGTIIMFRQGLQSALHNALYHINPAPRTFQQWVDAARAEQAKWAEWGAHGFQERVKRYKESKDSKCTWQERAKNRQKDRRSDAMDVDNVQVNAMTDAEKDSLMKKGACFFCKEPGHMARVCPKKKGRTNTWKTAPKRVVAKEATAAKAEPSEEPEEEDDDKETFLGKVRGMSREQREELMDSMLKDEGF
jgi:Retrotransposon gag protein/Zinc knuckle